MNKNGLFGRKSGKGLQYTTGSDDINSIAFDEAIAAAEASGNYRLSVNEAGGVNLSENILLQ